MVTISQVKNGLLRYIDSDIMPHLTGIKRLGFGVYVSLAADNAAALVEKYKSHPAVSMLDVVDASGNVDIDRLYQAAIPMFQNGDKQTIEIPMIGDLTFDRSDIEKLYRYIKG